MSKIKVMLLRGVNVAGANRLPMPEFREMLTELGLEDVQTHIQSGNAVFRDPGVAGLEEKVAAAMRLRFGFAPTLFVMDLTAYDAILSANPFKSQGGLDGAKVHVVFLASPAKDADLAGLRAHATSEERVHLSDAALYLLAPNGIGRSVLAEKLPRYVKVPQTARNQRSAEAISTMAHTITSA